MNFIKNILAIIGLIALLAGGYAYSQFGSKIMGFKGEMAAFNQLDPKAKDVYMEMWTKLKETGNTAEATVWKYPLEEGVSAADAEEAMASIANDENIKGVGELPLSDQVEAMTGNKQRLLKIYQYCDPLTAKKMVDHSDAFAAYLPCRIAMVEDKEGKINLYALNMDMMIYGGKTLPDDLRKEAIRVKEVMIKIMEGGAAGDF
ncbi:MAG: DUF302 domain-containing protein [Thiotrichaceae bacterium]|nr:DUF302 domain-containing protein [Thiotrichaceae bacterium]